MKLIFFFFTLLALNLNAQNTGNAFTDSLLNKLATSKEDSNKVLLLYQVGRIFTSSDEARAMHYATEGIAISKKINFQGGLAKCYHLTGSIYMNKGLYDTAMDYYFMSLNIDKAIKDIKGQAAAYINMGLTEYSRANTIQAMEYLSLAEPLARSIRDTNYLSLIYTSISNVYFNQKDYKKATEYSTRALNIATLTHNEFNRAVALASLGTQAHAQNDTVTALKYYTQSYNIYKELKNLQRANAVLGNIAILQTDKRRSLEIKLEVKNIWDTLSPSYFDAIKNTGNIGLDYFDLVRYPEKYNIQPGGVIPAGKKGRLDLAEKYLKEAVALSKQAGNMEWNWTYTHDLSDLMEMKGDPKAALAYLRESVSVYDSLYSQENKNQLAAIANRQEIALRDKQIQINALALSNQRKQRLGLIIGIGFLFITGILLYRQSSTRKKTNTTLLKLNTELDEANKLKAKFFAILSHDLRSPVASLVSFIEMQEEPGLISAADAETHKKQLSTAAADLLQNMEGMLLWSKEQMKQFTPDIQTVAVTSLYDYLQHFFSFTGNTIIKYKDDAKIKIATDENYLRTIMHNLTSNALKAVKDETPGTIEWNAWIAGGKQFLSITDNGPGMKQEQVNALNDQSATSNAPTGFGLHLIRDLAKAIDCKISMQSQPEEGTRFTLCFNG